MSSDPVLRAAAEAAGALLGGSLDAVERVRGFGRNSGVYSVRRDGARYALKQYPVRRPGERNRAAIETGALRLIGDHAIGAIPRPVAADPETGYALLEWIEGEAVTAPTGGDVAAAGEFLAAIHRLRNEREINDFLANQPRSPS